MTTFWRRPKRSPVCSTVRETCSCGAVFEMRAHPSRAGYEAQQFRARHAVCRSGRVRPHHEEEA